MRNDAAPSERRVRMLNPALGTKGARRGGDASGETLWLRREFKRERRARRPEGETSGLCERLRRGAAALRRLKRSRVEGAGESLASPNVTDTRALTGEGSVEPRADLVCAGAIAKERKSKGEQRKGWTNKL
eukprot:2098657-Pleurochrysis_carterae.AAC.1